MIKETLLETTADTKASLDSCTPRRSTALLVLTGLWLIIFFAALFTPPLLDDADATHASAARHMALSGDLVTLRVDGIRYLEKAPLPYWLGALSFRLFGYNSFAAHLPQAIGVLLLALLGYYWAYRAFNARTAFYTGLATLTTVGVFLFTRYYIPEVLLSFFLAIALFCLLRSLTSTTTQSAKSPASLSTVTYAYAMWTALALAVLTKGLVALVFFFGAAIVYLALSGEYKNWRSLKPFTGILLFLIIAAPWHILAGLRNTGGMNGHGFFWFYFINEHVLRFLGRRYPKDYNKLPGYLFWSLHLVWLFPWSLFCGTLCRQAYLAFQRYRASNPAPVDEARTFYWQPYAVVVVGLILQNAFKIPYIFTLFLALILFLLHGLRRRQSNSPSGSPLLRVNTLAQRSTLLLSIFASLVLVFFSVSTNQEYYTFPTYLSMILLLAVALAHAEQIYSTDSGSRRWITVGHATFTVLGVAIAITLLYGLWTSRHLPFVPDIGDLLAHRGVGDYTLSMSGIFDLTGPSFAALRLPATLAAIAFLIGPAIAWLLRSQRRHLAATVAVALTAATFFIAAHIAFARFAPMLSSKSFADTIQQLETDHSISRDNKVIFYGDQSYGSSITFYLGRQVYLVNGRSSSMLFGGTFPDAPPVFLTPEDLLTIWGQGERKLLFVPLERRDAVDQLLGNHKVLLFESSGKALFTDRPLDNPGRTP
ncbi:ArnT family glycosyltransferase [Tunturibacter empetritectus]|uniref:4-amino-4-deoxy-L-arabinose transferase-like glycosyltransferase n=1 Tax=Tunturiibacter empetritectus TaxID=3069691 RepID=A0A7W8MSF4_9BACT|nr:glycosyltransferase family 39 protein [Edaphobacter lichenicola]MBB5317815.1 4-amino-4-deoxy-L-arabinose transferase-like glycosyltransferase [Edaphobacter lichenicola]